MQYDTAGNFIISSFPKCDCGLTGGCWKCNIYLNSRTVNSLDEYLKKTANSKITIEEVRRITEGISLTKILQEMK